MPLKQSNYNTKASHDRDINTFAQKFENVTTYEGLDIEKLTDQQIDLQTSSLGAGNHFTFQGG